LFYPELVYEPQILFISPVAFVFKAGLRIFWELWATLWYNSVNHNAFEFLCTWFNCDFYT